MPNTIIQQLAMVQHNQLFIKRDDLIPISFGGNKARKAAYFFREIGQNGNDCIVTYGSSSSNHCRIISNMAAMRNLPCYIISPQEVAKDTFNQQMMQLFGAKIQFVPVEKVHDTIDDQLRKLRRQGKNPYFIAGGGHGNLGTQAYVDCYEEIKEYEEEHRLCFDYIFLASGTGTTQAGLVCGQLIHRDDRKIVGISIARKNPRGRKIVIDSIKDYLSEKKYQIPVDRIEQNTIFDDRYVGNGYGQDDLANTIKTVLVNYGIPLDSTYTAKAYAGMKKYLNDQDLRNKNVLFIHTGGTPLFFDDLKLEHMMRR